MLAALVTAWIATTASSGPQPGVHRATNTSSDARRTRSCPGTAPGPSDRPTAQPRSLRALARLAIVSQDPPAVLFFRVP